MTRARRLLTIVSVVGLVFGLSTPGTAQTASLDSEVRAQSERILSPSVGRKAAGSYYLEVLHEGFPPAAALVTMTRDGGFISTDVSDEGAGGLSTIDSPVHGTWKAIGRRTLEATTVYFGFDSDGIPVWIARSKGRFRFDSDFSSGEGELLVERFTFDQDPLDPTEVPADQLQATFTARRITAD